MKSLSKFFLAFCLFAMTSAVCNAERLLTDLSDLKEVKTVYISNMMIKTLGALGLNSIDGLGEYSSLMKDIKSVEIVSVEGQKNVKKRTKKIDKFVKKLPNTNAIVSRSISNSKKDQLKVLEHTNANTGESDGLIVYVKRETSIYLIHLEGSINLDSLSKF